MTGETESRRGALETLLLPLASAVVVAAAAVHSLIDRRRRDDQSPEKEVDGAGAAPQLLARSSSRPALAVPESGPLGWLARNVPWLRTPLAVNLRFGEIGGNHLAAAFTFQAFLSLFPLLVAAIAVAGFVSAGSDTDLSARVIEELGLEGQAANWVDDALTTAESSRRTASVVGVVGLLWSGLGLVGGLQHAYNAAWQVKPRGIRDKAFGLLWLAGAAILFVGSAALTTALRWLPGSFAPVGVAVTFAVSFALWLWTLRVLPNNELPWRALVPGAVLGALGLELLKIAGAYYVPRAVASSSALYGPLGVVIAVLAWLLFFGRLVVYSAVLNVVLYEKREGTIHAVVEAPATDDATRVATRAGRLVPG